MRSRVIALVVAATLIGGALFLRARRDGGDTSGAATTARTGSTAPVEGAVELLCPHEAVDLCAAAGDTFNSQKRKVGKRPAVVKVTVATSADDAARAQPVLWLASSSAWVDRVQQQGLRYETASVASSPIVLAMWGDRAGVLERTCPGVDLGCLRDAAANQAGWKALGGPETWGPVKVTHAHPVKADDGLLTIASLAYAYADAPPTVSLADDPQFDAFLVGIEDAVTTGFPSNDVAKGFVVGGPARADAALTSEASLVLQLDNARSRGPALRVFYPREVVSSDYPLGILDTATPAEKEVGTAFRDFLRSPEGQGLVARFGFRPADGAPVPPGTPLAEHSTEGVLLDIPASQTVPIPPADVLDALAQLWSERVGG